MGRIQFNITYEDVGLEREIFEDFIKPMKSSREFKLFIKELIQEYYVNTYCGGGTNKSDMSMVMDQLEELEGMVAVQNMLVDDLATYVGDEHMTFKEKMKEYGKRAEKASTKMRRTESIEGVTYVMVDTVEVLPQVAVGSQEKLEVGKVEDDGLKVLVEELYQELKELKGKVDTLLVGGVSVATETGPLVVEESKVEEVIEGVQVIESELGGIVETMVPSGRSSFFDEVLSSI